MKTKLKWASVIGCFMPLVCLPAVAANYYTGDFQRLQWLCSDYQISVDGYVIEGWFQITNCPGMERFLQEQLQITTGYHRVALTDGSILSTVMKRNQQTWQVELQLISNDYQCALQYYSRWQQFSDRFCRKNPVGITLVAQLPESIDRSCADQILNEVSDSLALQVISKIETERYVQVSGHSKQLLHDIHVNGDAINSSITIVPQQTCTYLYLASPVLYQQI